MGVEAMIFDFGNVLIGWDPENLYRKLIPDAAERKHFLTEICHGQWNAVQDAGRSWDEAIAERIALHPERADHIRAYRERFAEMLTGPVAEGHAILDKVHAAGIPCYGLTNWSSETYHASREAMPFLDRLGAGKFLVALDALGQCSAPSVFSKGAHRSTPCQAYCVATRLPLILRSLR